MFAKPSPSLSLTLTSLTLNFSKTRVAFYGGEGCPPRSSSSSLHCPPPPYIFLPATWKSDLKPSNLSGDKVRLWSLSPATWFGGGSMKGFLGGDGVFLNFWFLLLFSLPFPLWSVSSPVVECFSSRFHVCLLHGLNCFPCRILYYIIFDWPYARPRC